MTAPQNDVKALIERVRQVATDLALYALGEEGRPSDEQFQAWSVEMHKAADALARLSLPPELVELSERASKALWRADLHHTRHSCGRTFGFVVGDSIVPIAAVTLGVEGMPEDEGRANAKLIVGIVNWFRSQ
jgi:hypothetical protein